MNNKFSKQELLTFLYNKKEYIKSKYDIEILAVFGSMARGNYDNNSDIDLLYKPLSYDAFKLIDSLDYLQQQTNRKVELVSENSINPIIEMTSKKERIYV